MPALDLTAYKPDPGTLGDATQIASGFTVIEAVVNALTNVNFADGGALDIDKLAGFPSDGTKFLAGDGTWKGLSIQALKKTALKTVQNTVAETDLLNAEITIPAGALGANGFVLFHFGGQITNTTGSGQTVIWRHYLGPTKMVQGAGDTIPSSGSGPIGWSAMGVLANVGVTNSQLLLGMWAAGNNVTTATGFGNLGNVQTGGAAGYGGTAAEDTTAAKTMTFTIEMGVASASFSINLQKAVVLVFSLG